MRRQFSTPMGWTSRANRCMDDRQRQGRRRKPHHHAARLIAGDLLEQARNRCQADHFWVGETYEQLTDCLAAPDGPSAEIPVSDERDVHKRNLRRAAVKCNLDLLIEAIRNLLRYFAGGRKPGGEPGDRGFAMQRKRIVGSGRNAGDRHRAAFSHDRPVGAVAAKDDDDRNSGRTHQSGGAKRIFDRPGDRHL